MEVAMRQITFACQPSFEMYARPSRREEFLNLMEVVDEVASCYKPSGVPMMGFGTAAEES
jgi:hypothetical protein